MSAFKMECPTARSASIDERYWRNQINARLSNDMPIHHCRRRPHRGRARARNSRRHPGRAPGTAAWPQRASAATGHSGGAVAARRRRAAASRPVPTRARADAEAGRRRRRRTRDVEGKSPCRTLVVIVPVAGYFAFRRWAACSRLTRSGKDTDPGLIGGGGAPRRTQ
jgi:hypothetical protein